MVEAVGSLLPVSAGPISVPLAVSMDAESMKPPWTVPGVRMMLSEQAPVTLTVPVRGYWPEALAVVDWVRTAVTVMLVPANGTFPVPEPLNVPV
jgi:hypothetical protein